jgi:hypothetical protein
MTAVFLDLASDLTDPDGLVAARVIFIALFVLIASTMSRMTSF